MATVSEAYEWVTHGAELKSYLNITNTREDIKLRLWFEVAIEEADNYLGWAYTDSLDEAVDDSLDEPHPSAIKLGLYEFCRGMREVSRRAPGLLGKVTDRESETYGPDATEMLKKARNLAHPFWAPYKRQVSVFSNYLHWR